MAEAVKGRSRERLALRDLMLDPPVGLGADSGPYTFAQAQDVRLQKACARELQRLGWTRRRTRRDGGEPVE